MTEPLLARRAVPATVGALSNTAAKCRTTSGCPVPQARHAAKITDYQSIIGYAGRQMTIQLGLFDVFTYTIPGSLYLAVAAFVCAQLGWIDIGDFNNVPSIVLVGALLIGSYVAGFAADPIAAQLDRWMRRWKAIYAGEDIGATFYAQVPAAERRPYATANVFLLQALAETMQREVAMEISRFRATGLMLRNCAVPFLMASIVSMVEAAVSTNRAAAILCAVLFGAAALSCVGQGRRLRGWAAMKTLQICYWIPGIDEMITYHGKDGPSSPSVPHPRPGGGDQVVGK